MVRERESNIELLRILAMLAIVVGHFSGQGGVHFAGNGFLPILVTSAARLAVDVFLIIGCWFMVDAKFRPERIVKLYAEVCFYSIPITLAMVAIGEAGGFRNVVQGCVPFFGRSVWYATAYISLVALAPYLNRIFELPQKDLTRLVVLLFIVFCLVSTVPQFTPFEYLADFAWFPVVYIFVGWAKRGNVLDRLGGPGLDLALAVGMYVGLCAIKLTSAGTLADYWLCNIRGLPCLAFALLVFNAFRQMDLGRSRAINLLARSTFAVYIVHQVPAFEHFEWSLFSPETISSWSAPLQPVGLLTVGIIVFLVVAMVDAIRICIFDADVMRLRFFPFVSGFVSRFYGKIA